MVCALRLAGMGERNRATMAVLQIQNHGQAIVDSNYWDSPPIDANVGQQVTCTVWSRRLPDLRLWVTFGSGQILARLRCVAVQR
jgi:hypothetical protein